MKPGGKLFIFVFSDKNAARLIGPRHVSRARIRQARMFLLAFKRSIRAEDLRCLRQTSALQVFREAKGWRVESLEDKQYKVRPTNLVNLAHAEAVAAVVTKT